MCVVDACMVCIEGGGVITALHHQITNLTHHHQIHQRDARAEERYAITSRTFAVKRNDFDGSPLHYNPLRTACSFMLSAQSRAS